MYSLSELKINGLGAKYKSKLLEQVDLKNVNN